MGPGVTYRLRHCTTSRTVPGSIPSGVTRFFSDIFLLTVPWPWGRLIPYWKWVPGTFPGGKGGRCVRLTTSPPSCAECHEIWEFTPPGTLWATPGLLQDSFTFYPSVYFDILTLRIISFGVLATTDFNVNRKGTVFWWQTDISTCLVRYKIQM